TAAAVLMIGGGLANFLDRLPDGRVTDYVVLSAGPLRTGVFNLADAAILTGAILWLGNGMGGGWRTPSRLRSRSRRKLSGTARSPRSTDSMASLREPARRWSCERHQ